MNERAAINFGMTLAGVLALLVMPARADIFGTGPNSFTIDFVNVGNAGNANDAGLGGGIYSSPYGSVGYGYRMGTYEISQDVIEKATAGGLLNVTAGAHTGARPAALMSWYEAAAFVNFLNTSTGHQAAYQLSGVTAQTLWSSAQAWQLDGENLYRHKDAFYFLPSEDEWYKAANHKNDGASANYWDYATGSNMVPTAVASGTTTGTAVYDSQANPADVNLAGGLSPYGTMGQNGNAYEWHEDAFDGSNDSSSELRVGRGGNWTNSESFLRSSSRLSAAPSESFVFVGFRVASVPEPSCAMLMFGSGMMLLLRRSSRCCHAAADVSNRRYRNAA